MRSFVLAMTCVCLAAASCANGGSHEHAPAAADTRVAVRFPEELKRHTLANMRDHLATLQLIQEALARGAYDRAAELSEERLGLTSLALHNAHEVARYMPEGMQEAGSEMHRAASRLALEAANAGATGDTKAPLAALSRVTAQCVACHAAYRLE